MTPKPTLEDLVTDILKLDPSLKAQEADVRALVSQLLASQPEVTIDRAFLAQLRNKIVAQPVSTQTVSTHSFGWYFLRFAPLGAIALLLIILAPQPAHSPIPDVATEPNETSREVASTPTSPTTMMAVPADDDAVSLMAVSESMDTVPVDSFTFDALRPQMTFSVSQAELAAPSFIVIHAAPLPERGTIIGQSRLLPTGMTTDLIINLDEVPVVDTLYYITVYRDDGDEQFEEAIDMPAYDALGNPVSITVIGTRE